MSIFGLRIDRLLFLLIASTLIFVCNIKIILSQERLAEGDYLKAWHSLLDKIENRAYNSATISTVSVHPPIGYWVLLKKGNDACAIRFTSFRRAHPKDRTLRRTQESFFADYDWVYQADGTNDFNKVNIIQGSSKVSKKPNFWRFSRGNDQIECGTMQVTWKYPNGILLVSKNFNPDVSNLSNNIKVALTGWKKLSFVNANDARLVWEYYDPYTDIRNINNEGVTILVDEWTSPSLKTKPGSEWGAPLFRTLNKEDRVLGTQYLIMLHFQHEFWGHNT